MTMDECNEVIKLFGFEETNPWHVEYAWMAEEIGEKNFKYNDKVIITTGYKTTYDTGKEPYIRVAIKYTLNSNGRGKYHISALMYRSELLKDYDKEEFINDIKSSMESYKKALERKTYYKIKSICKEQLEDG